MLLIIELSEGTLMEWLYLIVFLILWSIVDHYKEKIRLKKLSKYDATITYQLRIRDIYKYNEIRDYEEYIKKAYPKLVVSGKYLIFNDIKYKRKTEFKYETESHNEAIFSIDSHFADLTNYEEYDLSEFIEFIPGIEENPNVLSKEEFLKKNNKLNPNTIKTSYKSKITSIKNKTKSNYAKEPINILQQYGISYIYHMTHIKNLSNILKYGLLSHNNNLVKEKIDNKDVNRRRNINEPIYNKNIQDYVPFYFNPKNAMLFVNKEIQDDIVILAFDKSLMFCENMLFTDRNASSNKTNFFNNLENINAINWECINAKTWFDYKDGKRKRMAEVLIPNKVPILYCLKIYCNNKNTEKYLKKSVNIEVEENQQLFF